MQIERQGSRVSARDRSSGDRGASAAAPWPELAGELAGGRRGSPILDVNELGARGRRGGVGRGVGEARGGPGGAVVGEERLGNSGVDGEGDLATGNRNSVRGFDRGGRGTPFL